MKQCISCNDQFCKEDMKEWKEAGEPFSLTPFICPDCYDHFNRKDLEDQFNYLMKEV